MKKRGRKGREKGREGKEGKEGRLPHGFLLMDAPVSARG